MDKYILNKIRESSFLVTGGAGFIGSNIVEYLLNNSSKHVRVLDNLSNGSFSNISQFLGYENFEFIEGDIRNYDTCLKACEGIDYVLHQAALGSVPRSISNPLVSHDSNVTGFLYIMYAAMNKKVQNLVFAASSSTPHFLQNFLKKK